MELKEVYVKIKNVDGEYKAVVIILFTPRITTPFIYVNLKFDNVDWNCS